MTPRHQCSLLLAAVLVCSAGAAYAAPQDTSPQARVSALAVAVREVRGFGAVAAPELVALAKYENAATAGLVAAIAEGLRSNGTAEGTDTAPANIQPSARKLVAAAGALLQARAQALPAITAALADPSNADVHDVLALAEARIYVGLCSVAARQYVSADGRSYSGTFDGMFASLDAYDREKIADGFLEILRSDSHTAPLRALAGEGLAQKGSKRHVEALRALVADATKPDPVRSRAMLTMARLGDRSFVDRQLAGIKQRMDAARKDGMTPKETVDWAQGYYASATLSQGIHDYEGAIRFYNLFKDAIEPIRDDLPGRADLAGVYYNLACLHSLKGEADSALAAFERAIAEGYDNVAWAAKDGDLANVRSDPRFKAALDKVGKVASSSRPASRPS